MPLLKSFVHVFPECQPLLIELKVNYMELEAMNRTTTAVMIDEGQRSLRGFPEGKHHTIGMEQCEQGEEGGQLQKDSVKSYLSEHEGSTV
jgi:hypothetical protein